MVWASLIEALLWMSCGIAEAEKQGLGFQETGLVAHSIRRNFSLELLIYPRILG